MRKNGFTLIELLAVIVILAIIALIATPIILGIINDAREKANERSVELYASAVRNGIAAYQLTGLNAPKSFSDLTIQYDGDVKCSVQELYEDGSFYLEGCKVNNGEKEYSYGTKQESDVVKLCTANTTKATALVWKGNDDPSQESSYAEEEVGLLASVDGAYTPGTAYSCNFIDNNEENNMTLFVLSSTENEVTLILGSNLGGTVAWSADGSNHKDDLEEMQAVTAKAALADRTSTWEKLTVEQKATIKLPTMNQITEAGDVAFNGSAIAGLPKWLYSFTSTPVAYGYWTATPYELISDGPAWHVHYGGNASYDGSVGNDGDYGVRPVITLSKTTIN